MAKDEKGMREYVSEAWANEVVRNIFIYSFLAWSMKNIYDENVFTGYLFNLVDHHTGEVGVVAGVSGLTMVILAPSLGVISDKYGRIVLLRAGTVLGYLALSLMIYSITVDSYSAILCSQVLFGAYWACTTPTMDALLADWTDLGTRSKIYTARLMVMQLASTTGPLLSIFLFLYLGNTWDMKICRNVMYVGLVLFLIPATLLYFLFPKRFDDNRPAAATDQEVYAQLPAHSFHVPEEEGEGGVEMEMEMGVARRLQLEGEADDDRMPNEAKGGGEKEVVFSPIGATATAPPHDAKLTEDPALPSLAGGDGDFDEEKAEYCSPYCLRHILLVPAMISTYEIMTMLASGMTVKFFPIFFLHVLRLDPVHVQFIYLCSPLLTATAATFVTGFSKHYGRIEVTVAVRLTGITLLLLLACLTHLTEQAQRQHPEDAEATHTLWTLLMVAIFLMRTSIMNSTKPLTKSILMDFVPKNQRGKWNALQSVNVFSWAGSAVVGGYLIDKFDFAGIFVTTGLMQVCAIAPLLLVRSRVPMEQPSEK